MIRETEKEGILGRVGECLAQVPPLFPPRELEVFVDYFFRRGPEFLDLLKDHPSPLYVYEPRVLRERALRFRETFAGRLPDTAFYFAVKSNNCPEVARTALEAGFGLDVSSGLELETAISLGAGDIIFSGPGKTEAELALALRHRARVTVLLDSFGEMKRLAKLNPDRAGAVRVGVRLATQAKGLWRKFGILPEELPRFCAEVRGCPGLDFRGLQFHTSWNLTPEVQESFVGYLAGIIAALPARDRAEISFIDIGGGYWPEQGEWLQPEATGPGMLLKSLGLNPEDHRHYRLPAQPLAVFAERLSAVLRAVIFPHLSCRICFEPGRWICNDAMHLLLTVVDVKDGDIAITDGGTNAIGWERFESDYFPVLNLSRPEKRERRCAILGSLCTPHDLWGHSYWGRDISPGDVLLVPTQGAYTYSLRQHFIKPLPEVVALVTNKQGPAVLC